MKNNLLLHFGSIVLCLLLLSGCQKESYPVPNETWVSLLDRSTAVITDAEGQTLQLGRPGT